jgi:hypothetical protein
LRNHEKRVFALLEIKCRQSELSYAQRKTFGEIDTFLRRGVSPDWTYLGFNLLQFENTGFHDGRAKLNGHLIDEHDFTMWLKINF